MTVTKQMRKAEFWIDEASNQIPVKDLKKKELVLEDITHIIAKEAIRQNEGLTKLKESFRVQVSKAVEAIMEGYSGKKTEFKGNYTIYNFDRSIKVMVKVSQPIKFDELTIGQAKSLLDEFLSDGVTAKNSFIKQMVLGAFETRSNQMDTRKVMGLKRYADRIEDERYKQAMQKIDEAIRRPETATYYQVWVRDEQGKYNAILLDLAKI